MSSKNPHKLPLPLSIGWNITKIEKVDERGLLYYLDYKANYYKLEKYLNMMVQPQCSTFLTDDENGNKLFCRNYDFPHWRYNERTDNPDDITGLQIVVRCTNKKAKYKSIGVVDGFWLDSAKGRYFEGVLTDGKTDISRIAMAPLVIMDGANEVGLAVSIMHLPTENYWEEIDYVEPDSLDEKQKRIAVILDKSGERPKKLDYKIKSNAICINTADKLSWKVDKNHSCHQTEPGKKEIFHPVLMRKMLDFCKDVDEAIELTKKYNVRSPLPDNDYHIMVSDKSGKSVILEWVDNKLNIVERQYGTNYYLSREDKYGYGHDRDEIVGETLKKNKKGMPKQKAMDLLEAVSQDIRINKFGSISQWSSIYDLNNNTLDLALFMNYDHIYKYTI